jgi:hypothetical protein
MSHRRFVWVCPCCGRSDQGTEAWQEHAARCEPYRAWIAELRAEMEMLQVRHTPAMAMATPV